MFCPVAAAVSIHTRALVVTREITASEFNVIPIQLAVGSPAQTVRHATFAIASLYIFWVATKVDGIFDILGPARNLHGFIAFLVRQFLQSR